jgi:hypothetical protein
MTFIDYQTGYPKFRQELLEMTNDRDFFIHAGIPRYMMTQLAQLIEHMDTLERLKKPIAKSPVNEDPTAS